MSTEWDKMVAQVQQPKDDLFDDGVIYPPPDIKTVCDKTAVFVAKNGVGFEDRIREKELLNPKFCFLHPHDPFHKYYQMKIKESKEQKDTGPQVIERKEKKVEQPKQEVKYIPVPPLPYDFYLDFPPISKQDLEIVKLTAQFAARNGSNFINTLSAKEAKNYQFDFLRPTHSFYAFFMRLVEQYRRILVPPRNAMTNLENYVNNRYLILEKVMKKVEYEAWVLQEKENAQVEADKEKIAMATIDWHDFVVVETIEFLDADDRAVLPPPLTLHDLEAMTLEQKKALLNFEKPKIEADEDMDVDDEVEMDIDEEDDGKNLIYFEVEMEDDNSEEEPEKVEELNGAEEKTRNTYVPRVGRHAKSQQTQVCTICNQVVKVSEMDEHIRIELLDPRYREKRAALQAREKPSNLVQGENIAGNLKNMAKFIDTGAKEDVTLAQKIAFDQEKQKEQLKQKVIWDGHAGSAGLAQAKMQAIQSGPEPKRQKTTNANALYLTINYGDKSFMFEDLTPLWTVSQLKARLAPICGLAAGKQKIVTASNVVLKNALTLYQSEIASGDTLTLQLKK